MLIAMRWNWTKTALIAAVTGCIARAASTLVTGEHAEVALVFPIVFLVLCGPFYVGWDIISGYRERHGLWTHPAVAAVRWASIGRWAILAFIGCVTLFVSINPGPGTPPHGLLLWTGSFAIIGATTSFVFIILGPLKARQLRQDLRGRRAAGLDWHPSARGPLDRSRPTT